MSPVSDVAELFWDKALYATAYLIFVLLGSPLCRARWQLVWLGLGVVRYRVGLVE
jgi:hypothetical protein